jgi:hypothetical protein
MAEGHHRLAVGRGQGDQPVEAVIGEGGGISGAIDGGDDVAVLVVDEIFVAIVWVGCRFHAIEPVKGEAHGLTIGVSHAGQLAVVRIGAGLQQHGLIAHDADRGVGQGGLAPHRVIAERRYLAQGVGDAGQPVDGIVGEVGDIALGVGCGGGLTGRGIGG